MEAKNVAVSQFDGSSMILILNIDAGSGHVLPANQIPENKISFGFFDIHSFGEDSKFLALLATSDGPHLFFNRIRYRPELGKTSITLNDSANGESSHFLVSHQGSRIFDLSYERKFGIGLHPYNKERKDIDFYFWLYIKVADPKFYEVYTKNFFDLS